MRRDLGALHRHSVLEAIYEDRFRPLVIRKYGSSEAYLRLSLGWPAEESMAKSVEDGVVASGTGDRYWTAADEVVVRANDWPYSVPHDVS